MIAIGIRTGHAGIVYARGAGYARQMLERWLGARDAAALRRAWTALAPRRHEVSQPRRELTVHGAAQLAAAMLGERADWIVDLQGRPPEFRVDRKSDACFVDDAWDVSEPCREIWELHERRDGARGVQVVTVGCGTIEGRPEGGSSTVVRVFDRDRAASVLVSSNKVSTIGEIDLAPLDLYLYSKNFELAPASLPVEMMRGLVAQLAGELDAHYDTYMLWPCVAHDRGHTFAEGERSVTIVEQQSADGRVTATTRGLTWGHKLEVSLHTYRARMYGSVLVRLPDADIDRVIARLAAIATLE